MAGYSRIYVFGEPGGFMGADGPNPIQLMILVGDSDREWFEPRYFDQSIGPTGSLRTMVPSGPNDADALLDACIAFAPKYFRGCASLSLVEQALSDSKSLDFNASPEGVPHAWTTLREEARPVFARLHIWQAVLSPLQQGTM